MAIVAEYQQGNGVVKICDDAYRDVSREEMARRLENARRVAWEMLDKRRRTK